ncbi:unnamed product [Ostreococcus tauri]|uniref:Unnamed product n=1 Tax=Ostreococcus tauri TaxID=70448 RepID=A0A096PBE4_OSTTA|nr:unnamed product [Ostreococcus tauri]CEG01907.1 unnamed product [Ostreococcus tauri]|eukprot:XP_003084307.2 unnamed product [Ostreococcus tauri]
MACFLVVSLSLSIRVRDIAYKKRTTTATFRALRDMTSNCKAFEFVSPSHESAKKSLSSDLAVLLALTDAVFVLTTLECKFSLPNVPWACVKGKVVDSCIPKHLKALIRRHAYATSISHAFIFMYAHLQGYEHVTIVEDDAFFAESVRGGLIDDVRAVLQGPDDWSFIRLGYRPFFLEAQHKKSTGFHLEDPIVCPSSCICAKFGSNTCRMVESGCDMRGSHFYIANGRVFESMLTDLLDVSEKHRVIDWFVLHRYRNQVYSTGVVAVQGALDIPRELQEGYAKLFERLCVFKR